MANIRDVASYAGVSVSSVSNVLNGRTDQMRNSTLLRIQQAMDALNYHPNRIAQQLKTGLVHMFGLLVPSIVNPSFSALAREVDLAAREHSYRVLLGNTYRQEDEERAFIEDMFAHGVRGIIVAASDIRKTHFAKAAEQGMVIINYDNRLAYNVGNDISLFDSISMDNVEAGRLAASHLIERGCRNIVFATEASLSMSRSHKIDGFQTVIRNHNLTGLHRIVEGKALGGYGDTEMTDLGYALAKRILAITPRPDGVVAINDALGIGLLAGLRDAGIDIPREISVIGIDNIPLAGLTWPAMSSVNPPLNKMASLMIERLLHRIEDPTLPPGEFLFPPSLVCRHSVREA
ncbi:LacI family DNA-binding transcriptional regulator [Serratia sp. AKBS12]|uniref:LacI family DNA-binding transcriptional regulator n=1 Tax=Serratia sp. AKBS12 TaxID=2974597 RepID=UPI002166925D|nr:substrate-binding domain-containing protein [Serratia sp. AKBS12]MCS3407492.1 substrate-binding domain-containing protein [Serratia sp. AKBS12]MCS3407980.1 substrate-binding domain-containing protein [Serratia sp. AKBS12]